ncbi:MAG: AraC family transcriptional regulator [Lachnospiraceae bacterium]|nr:AraC family transcriptional regulator [Lachnospiraceae bacterium]
MVNTYRYAYFATDKLLNSLSVYNAGYEKCHPGYQWGPGVRDHYLIHHIIRGKGCYTIENRTYHLGAGDTFLLFPNVESNYRADMDEPWEYAWVGFAGTDAYSIIANTGFSKENPVLHQTGISQELFQKIRAVYEVNGNTFEDAVSMTGRLYSLMGFLMKHSGRKEKKNNHQLDYVERARQYIEEQYSYPITVEDVAVHTGISRSYLFRLFSSTERMSPKEYLLEYRIRQACQLLKQTDLSVQSIAHSVGFEDNLYFSKVFKKYRNCTPSEYRGLQI